MQASAPEHCDAACLEMPTTVTSAQSTVCFLCAPDPRLVFAGSDRFFAMLGLGPIGLGYSLIATREHEQSMLDLDAAGAAELVDFTGVVRDRLSMFSEHVAIGEHGRIALCLAGAGRLHEPHCLHAHQLLFPGLEELPLGAVVNADVERYDGLPAAVTQFPYGGQYLFSQASDGLAQVAAVRSALPRQLLRTLAATLRQEGEEPDWRAAPRWPQIEQARAALGLR